MKKIALMIIGILMTVCIASCGGANNEEQQETKTLPEFDPVSILTADNVYAAINYEYVPVVDSGVIVHEDNTSTAVYVSDPKGQGDSVEISVTQMTDTVSEQDIRAEYNQAMQKRTDTIPVSNLGEGAYIAFPSIYVYDRGCILKITAGSGNNSEQQNLLISLATTASANLDSILLQSTQPEGK